MAHREFTDPQGVLWQVWEVIPSSAERRSAGERRFGSRDKRDRRSTRQFRVPMEDGMAHGWLVFESDTDKRRLHPIPAGWTDRTDEELTALCERAEPAARPSSRPPA